MFVSLGDVYQKPTRKKTHHGVTEDTEKTGVNKEPEKIFDEKKGISPLAARRIYTRVGSELNRIGQFAPSKWLWAVQF
jgi:hypothetical protein